ncbi:transglutaminase domain-containing protein [candidate division CSSED10-310 bacterium]|uniref:Transglutaminase domain-containing protein n=1 Tax=candidate division CSSED10-310 bacterium TaxID=2855610 RepID=A0ABV6Z5Q0_UNCC1
MHAIELINKVAVPTEHPASLAFHEQGIWVADIELGQLFLLDHSTGSAQRVVDTIVARPETISWDGEFLWEYDEETSVLFKHGLDGKPSYRFGRIEGVNTPYYGFTYKHKSLWVLTPDQPEFTVANNKISVIDFPRAILSETFEAPRHSCRGLCHDGQYLWTLDVEGNEVFMVDPRTGVILNSYELGYCDSPSSLVVTEDRVWTLNLKSNELLTYALNRNVIFSTSGGRRSDIEIVYTLRNNGSGDIKQVDLFNSLPAAYLNQNVISESKITPPPDAILKSQWDEGEGQVVLHKVKDIGPAMSKQMNIAFSLDTVNLKFHIFPHKTGTLDDIPPFIHENYLLSELMKNPDKDLRDVVKKAQLLFQTGEKEIQDKVRDIIGPEKNPYWIARLIYDFVVDTIKYVLPYASVSSRKILKQGTGSCGNHATIFIAFCQVAGLPARSIVGFSLWKDDSRLGYLDHEIPEVYFPQYGWVPVDTSRFMSLPILGTHPLTKFRSFGTLSDRFFVNGFGRDLRSPFALKRHREENLVGVEGPAAPELRFFMRWKSKPIDTGIGAQTSEEQKQKCDDPGTQKTEI